MSTPEKTAENFCCPKCRNHEAISREASLPKGTFADLLGLNLGGRYLLVTCSLCGYTELYDLAIVARAPAPQVAKPAEAEIP